MNCFRECQKKSADSKAYGGGRGVGVILGVALGLGVDVAVVVAVGVGVGLDVQGLLGQSKISMEAVGVVGA